MDYNNNDRGAYNENNDEKSVEENNSYIENNNNNNNANIINNKEDIRIRDYNNNPKKMVSFADLQDTTSSISTNTTQYYNNYRNNNNNINEANVKKNFNSSYRYNNRYKKGRFFNCSNQYRNNFQQHHEPSHQGYDIPQHNQNPQQKPRFTEQLNYKPQEQSQQEQEQKQVYQQNSQQSYAVRPHVYYEPEVTLSYQQQLQRQQYELQQYYKQQKFNNYHLPHYSSRFNNFQHDKSTPLQQQQFHQQQNTSKQQFSWQQLQNHSKLEQPQQPQYLQQQQQQRQTGYNSNQPQLFYNQQQQQVFYNSQFQKQYSDVKFKKPNFGSGRIIANPWGRNRKQRRVNPQFQLSRNSNPQYISSHNCVNLRFPQNTGTTTANSQLISNSLKTALHGGSCKDKKEIKPFSSQLNPHSKPYQNLKSISKANVVLINTPHETPKDFENKGILNDNDVKITNVVEVSKVADKDDSTTKEISTEKVLEKKRVQASVSDIVIKKDAERYAFEKGLDSVSKDDVNDEDAEIEYDNGNNDGDDDEQWEDIDEEVCIELAHGFKHYEGEYEYADDNVYYHGGDEVDDDDDDEEDVRLNRSDESFQQFIIDNTLNLEPSHMLGSNKRSSSMLMLPSSLSSLQPSLSSQTLIPGRLVSQLSYPDVLDWSDNVDSLTPLPSHREGVDAGGGDDSAENSACCGVFGNESGLYSDDDYKDVGKNDEGDDGKKKRVFGVEGDDGSDTCSETHGDGSDVGELMNMDDLTGDVVEGFREIKGREKDVKDIKTCLRLQELNICESVNIVKNKEVIKDCCEKLTDVDGRGPLKSGDVDNQDELKIVKEDIYLETLKEGGKSNLCDGGRMTDNEKSRKDEEVTDVCVTETANGNGGDKRNVDGGENIKCEEEDSEGNKSKNIELSNGN